MLVRLEANKPEFRTIEFKPGFNAIVADKAADATEQHSRNARGKSTLLMLINWVLAGNKNSSLTPLGEQGWAVSLTLQMFGGQVRATRELSGGSRLDIAADATASPFIEPYLIEGRISVDDWKTLLGLALFRLEPPIDGNTGGPSVRTLLSYVVRTDTPKDPFKVIPQQSAQSSRTNIAFLMGLDWTPVRELASIKHGLDQLSAISAATRAGLVSTLRPESELLLEKASLRNETDEWHKRIGAFRVLEDPEGLIGRADELTKRLAILRDDAVTDRRMHDLYLASLDDASTDHVDSALVVAQLFEASGAVLADGFKRRMDEVQAFHELLISNRRAFLTSEMREIDQRSADRDRQLSDLSGRREMVMLSLKSGGALEELLSMRSELAEIEARISAVEEQLGQARELVAKRDELKLQKAQQRTGANEELAASRAKLDAIGERFGQKMKRLYAKDAVLTATVDDAGYKFTLKVTGSGSTGVDRATMFAFDLTMLEEGIVTSHHPDFLIHDSNVFDGVDPRQRAGILQFAQEMVQATGGQYICTINSNDIPSDVLAEPWFREGIVRTVLDTEAGGALGLSF